MNSDLIFDELHAGEFGRIQEMSDLASKIVKEYYDPLLGEAQNDYMIKKFQSAQSIADQLASGKRYFFVRENGEGIGFICFYPREDAMYLSKLYLRSDRRGKGYARQMLTLVAKEAKKLGLYAIELNVNKYNKSKFIYEKLGFTRQRAERIDIGNGYFMDDYVYRLNL